MIGSAAQMMNASAPGTFQSSRSIGKACSTCGSVPAEFCFCMVPHFISACDHFCIQGDLFPGSRHL